MIFFIARFFKEFLMLLGIPYILIYRQLGITKEDEPNEIIKVLIIFIADLTFFLLVSMIIEPYIF